MIPGLTDKTRLPRLGKIRLGEKRQGQRGEYPAALEHFNLADVPWLVEHLGEKPRTIEPITFSTDNQEDIFPTALKAYRKSGLFCKCQDGETASRSHVGFVEEGPGKGQPKDPQGYEFLQENGMEKDVNVGDFFEMPCPGVACPFWEKSYCKNNGRLLFMLRAIKPFGCYEIQTTSRTSIKNISNYLAAVRQEAGTVRRIPFSLHLKPHRTQAEGKPKTVFVLVLEQKNSPLELARMGQQILRSAPEQLSLPPAPNETPDDLYPHGGEALDAEFSAAGRDDFAGNDPEEVKELAHARKLGREAGLNDAQVEMMIRKAGRDIMPLIVQWTDTIEAKKNPPRDDDDPFAGPAPEPPTGSAPDPKDKPTAPAATRGGLLDV